MEAEYHALRKVVRLLALRFDISSEGDSLRLRQVFENAKAMLEDAAARLRAECWVGSLDLAFVDTETVDEYGAVA